MRNTLRSLALAIAIAAGSSLALPAYACGGFFCFTQPVDQSAERILYIQEGGKITVHIQISYTGDDQNFSWILPLTKAPEGGGLKPSSDSVFQLLEQTTAPRFQLNWKANGDCQSPMCYLEDAQAGGGPPTAGGGSGGVQVLLQQNVGPYEAVVIKGTSSAEIIDWLNANKFVQPKSTQPLIQQYVKDNYVFLALKLQKDKSAGDLTPIAVTLDEVGPCLPIRLTALATAPDMPIVAWVVGKARAIPKNFLHVELNDAAIDWLKPGSNYKTVVSKAVDLGSGHAFLTEIAKKTKDLPIQFASAEWDAKDFEKITDPGQFLQMMISKNLPRTTQIQNLIKKYVKKPDAYKDVSDQEYFNCIQNSGSGMPGEGKCKEYLDAAIKAGFDGAAFAKDLNELVIQPLKTIDKQYKDQPYLTRLYTTLSAEEMTKDPIFGYNGDLPEVSNQHTAEATPLCPAGSKTPNQAKLKFADGFELTVPMPTDLNGSCGNWSGPASFGKGTGPAVEGGGFALKRVQVLDEKGAALEIDQSDADRVDAQLNAAQLGTPSLKPEFIATLAKVTWNPHTSKPGTATPTPTPAAPVASSADSGCTSGNAAPTGAWLMLAGALGLVGWRRRRSQG